MVLYEPIDMRANPPDGDKGDITVSGGGTVFTIDPNTVSNGKLAQMPAQTVKANLTGATASPQDVTVTALGAAITPANNTVVIGGGVVSGKMFGVDVCATPKRAGVFTFALPASVGNSRVGKPVLIQQGPGRDEADPILSMVAQVVSPTAVKVVWQSAAPFSGRVAVNYLIGA